MDLLDLITLVKTNILLLLKMNDLLALILTNKNIYRIIRNISNLGMLCKNKFNPNIYFLMNNRSAIEYIHRTKRKYIIVETKIYKKIHVEYKVLLLKRIIVSCYAMNFITEKINIPFILYINKSSKDLLYFYNLIFLGSSIALVRRYKSKKDNIVDIIDLLYSYIELYGKNYKNHTELFTIIKITEKYLNDTYS